MNNLRIGKFARSSTNDFGTGKIREIDSTHAVVEYFDTPTDSEPPLQTTLVETLSAVELQRQTRVYFYDKQNGYWRMGRVEAHIENANHEDRKQDIVYIALPNKQHAAVAASEVFVRWDRPLTDPWSHLEARLTETPYFHSSRSALISALIAQRAAAAGMTALLSSPIELEPHQIEIVNRVLKDPCQRYLLADEVGLGKTIEAGVILRQHILDSPDSHEALIVVPEGLVGQWTDELRDRCQVDAEQFGHSVEVITHSEMIHWQGEDPHFIIIDEAHQIVRHPELFEKIRQISAPERCPKLLLLSATPVLGNEEGFLSLLHLLDPLVNRLEDAEAFKERVSNRQDLANLFGEFMEEQDIYHLPTVVEDLKAHFPHDKRLASMLEEVEKATIEAQQSAAFENPPELKQAVGRARSHLSESYRLHRRILRNRRNKTLEEVLTGRDRLVRVPYEDPTVVSLEEALENWREQATASLWGSDEDEAHTPLADIFMGFVQAAWGEPDELLRLVRLRKGILPEESRDHGPLHQEKLDELTRDTPHFDNEEEALDRILDLENRLEFSRQQKLKRLGEIIRDVSSTDGQIVRLAFFASSPALADDLFQHLVQTYGERLVTRHSTRSSQWQSRWKRSGPQFLVCDWTAEEGLNLQGGKTCLIHLDFPLSPNRVEQRIGRLDRFGVGNPVISFHLEEPSAPLAKAWIDCLDEGWRIFSKSIAALQYVVDEEIQALKTSLFMDGVETFKATTERLSSKGGIQRELRLIRNQDALDSIETSHREDSIQLLDQLDEVSRNSGQFREIVDSWTLERLQYIRVGEKERKDPVFRYHYQSTERGSQTLISRNDFLQWFEQAIDSGAHHQTFRQPLSFPMAFSRQTARARKVGIARLGNPWIDCLMSYAHQDDRGNAFALWRQVDADDLPDGQPGRVFFRLDYLIEANLGEEDDPSIKRKADAFFPPIHLTLWIDQDLEVPEDELLEWLEEPYCDREDVNIRPQFWSHALESLQIRDWAGICEQVRLVADQILLEQTDLKNVVDSSLSRFDEANQIAFDQTKSRLECFGHSHNGLEHELASQEEEATQLRSAIIKPKIRLDSCGAVFLSPMKFETPVTPED